MYLIVLNMQCLQYENIWYMWKGHQNNPQTQRILPHWVHAPGFEISGSAPVLELQTTDLDYVYSKNA